MLFKVSYGPVKIDSSYKEKQVQSLPRKMKTSGHVAVCFLGNVLDRILRVTLNKGSYLEYLHPPTYIPSPLDATV